MWVPPEDDQPSVDGQQGDGNFSPPHGRKPNSANNLSGQGDGYSLEPPEGMQLCPHLDFRPARPTSDLGPTSVKIINFWGIAWLGLCAFTAEGADSVPGRGAKIPQAAQRGQKKKEVINLLPRATNFVQQIAAKGNTPLTLTHILPHALSF